MSEQMDLLPNEPKAVSVADKQDALMAMVLEKGNIEVLERFIALREREEARQSQLEFDRNFTAMRREFKPVEKTKKSHVNKYTPLEAMQELYDPIIYKHGFSYSWDETALEGGTKRVTLKISGYGHTRLNSFDVPVAPTNGSTNAIQAAGIMSTYGQRYTFKAGFGIVTKDEDTDGNLSFMDGAKYASEFMTINSCRSMDDLATAWSGIHKALTAIHDQDGIKVCTVLKDKRKKELSNGK